FSQRPARRRRGGNERRLSERLVRGESRHLIAVVKERLESLVELPGVVPESGFRQNGTQLRRKATFGEILHRATNERRMLLERLLASADGGDVVVVREKVRLRERSRRSFEKDHAS